MPTAIVPIIILLLMENKNPAVRVRKPNAVFHSADTAKYSLLEESIAASTRELPLRMNRARKSPGCR